MNLPNLIVIGAMKCGTTSLHNYLGMHPEIFMSEKKEIDFFIKERAFDYGIEWYKRYFPVNAKIRGESSQDYSKYHWWSGVPERIHSHLGTDVKFIYIIRNPLDRVYSHYSELQHQNIAPDSLEQYITKDLEENEIVLTSCYSKQLKKYLEFFPIDNFYVVKLEDLKNNRLATMNQIFNFLGLYPLEKSEIFNFQKNTTETKYMRNRVGEFVAKNSFLIKLKKRFSTETKQSIKRYIGYKKIAFKKINQGVKLSNALEKELICIFKEDLANLNRIINQDLDYSFDRYE